MAGKKRFPGPPPRILGRGLQAYLVELQDWLYKLWQSLAIIVTQGFEDIAPEDVNITAVAGTETLGWAAADHEHRLGIVSEAGDLITHDGTDPVALPVGDDGAVLTADASAAAGLAYHSQLVHLMQKCTSFWRMEEATGELRLDSIGRNDLTLLGSPAQVSGQIGNAVEIVSASTQALYIPDGVQSGLNPGHGDFSLCCWLYPTTTGAFVFLDKGITNNVGIQAVGYSLSTRITVGPYGSGLHADFGAYDASETTPDLGLFCQFVGTPPLNTWTHVVATFDRDGICKMYMNGVRTLPQPAFVAIDGDDMSREADTTGNCAPAAAFTLGGYSDNVTPLPVASTANCRLDAVGYFTGVLTPSDVALLFSAGRGLELQPLWSERDDEALAYAMM